MNATDATWVPKACTLPTAEQPLRLAEFEDLFAAVRAVTEDEQGAVSLDLDPVPATAARAAELVARETACCSFFTFALIATGGSLRLDVSVPPAHRDVLAALAGRARAGAR